MKVLRLFNKLSISLGFMLQIMGCQNVQKEGANEEEARDFETRTKEEKIFFYLNVLTHSYLCEVVLSFLLFSLCNCFCIDINCSEANCGGFKS